jgi:DNA-binding CsgD family transcriptional regulator
MAIDINTTNRNDNLKDYAPLKEVWEANASESPGKVLAEAQAYLENLPPLVGTGPFTTVIFDLHTSQFKAVIGNFKEIFAMDFRKDMSLAELIPLMYPSHSAFITGHFATYLNYILPRSLEERNQVDLTVISKYLRGNKYYWISIRTCKYFSHSDENLGYVILEYADITEVKNDNCAKFIMYARGEGYIVNEVLHPNCSMLNGLTPTELAVTRLISQGLSDKEIAVAQSSATGTIKQHKKHIFSKLAISKSTELVALAFECGLV